METEYDDAGREIHRRVTTLDADYDGDVRRISTAYDDLGRRSTVTQHSHATNTAVVDEVKFTYDGWGNVSKFEQDHDSAVGGTLELASAPDGGLMARFFFVQDPDGYKIEVLQRHGRYR